MKSTKIESSKTYPWIGISDLQIVVLFTSPKAGVQLHHEKAKLGGDIEIGQYSGAICEENFKVFTGQITLSN